MFTETIWQHYQRRLLGFLIPQTNSPILAEDILQQVFIKLLQHPPKATEGAALEAWLFRVCRHTLIDHYRKHSQSIVSIEAVPESDLALEESTDFTRQDDTPVMLHCMHNALTTLPQNQAKAIYAADLEDTSHVNIAQQYGVSPATVRSWVSRGRKSLRSKLQHCKSDDCLCNELTPASDCCAAKQP